MDQKDINEILAKRPSHEAQIMWEQRVMAERNNGEKCEWSLDPDGVYETSCGEEFCFDYGGRVVEDNNFLFCPFCGKPVREA